MKVHLQNRYIMCASEICPMCSTQWQASKILVTNYLYALKSTKEFKKNTYVEDDMHWLMPL